MAGRVVLITGGAGGIARATAALFLRDGATVVLADIDSEGLAAATEHLSPAGRVVTVPADITSVAECDRMVGAAVYAGGLDVLVNAAGVWTEGPTQDATEAEWDRTLAVNLKGTFFACRFAIPHLVRTGGCIVNVSSDAGLVGNPANAIYNASKGGVNVLTKSLALELAPRGVRVNAVCPVDVDTPMLAGQARDFGGGDPRAYLGRLLATYPQGPAARFVRPDEVAALIEFLASSAAEPITGTCIPIDFGVTAGY